MPAALRWGLVAACAAVAGGVAAVALATPPRRVRFRDLGRVLPPRAVPHSIADCGLVTLATARVPPGLYGFALFRTDGTHRGTERLGRFLYSQASAGIGGPVAGACWTYAPSPDTDRTSFAFLDPVDGVIQAADERIQFQLGVTQTERAFWFAAFRPWANEIVVRALAFPRGGGSGGDTSVPAFPHQFEGVGDGVVFSMNAGDGAGEEPWAIASPGAEAVRLADVRPGPESSAMEPLGAAAGLLVFSADDGVAGREPWVADPVAGTAERVADLRPGPQGSTPYPLGARSGRAVVSADDGAHGREPWIVDPVARMATLLDLAEGPQSSSPSNVTWTRAGLWIAALDAERKPSAWLVQGSEAVRKFTLPAAVEPQDYGVFAAASGEVTLYAEREGILFEWVVQRVDDAPAGTLSDFDGDGFTDDVEIALGVDPSDSAATPFANARAVTGPQLELRDVRASGRAVRVECSLPAPIGGGALGACGLIVDAGGAVAGAFFGEGQRVAVNGRATIRRARGADGRVIVRASIPAPRAPRTDGPGGEVPVLVWRNHERSEAAGGGDAKR